jgi:ATP-dependent DNA helicase RecG
MTEADLGVKSIPRNPLLFAMLHRMEAVEHIGSGIKRIRNLCREYGVAEPRIEVSEHWFTVIFPRPEVPESSGQVEMQTETDVGITTTTNRLKTAPVPSLSQVCPKSVPSHLAKLIMQAATAPADLLSLMALAQHTNRTRFRRTVLQQLINADLLELTVPEKPRSSKQEYRLTSLGREILKQQAEEEA